MRFAFILCLALISLSTHAPKAANLRKVETFDVKKPHQSIIYGYFIQRLGFSSGGFPQYITVQNTDSQVVYRFRVKDTFKSAKKSIFCYYILPGDYVILAYEWAQSKWYGGKLFTEPVYKNDVTGTTMQASPEMLFKFRVEPGVITYVGTWNFGEPKAVFTDDNEISSAAAQKNYKKMDFSNAQLSIPY